MEADMGKRIRIDGVLGSWDPSRSLFDMFDYLHRGTEALILEFGAHHIGAATLACYEPRRLLYETTYVQCFFSGPMSLSLHYNAVSAPSHRHHQDPLSHSSQYLERLRHSISNITSP